MKPNREFLIIFTVLFALLMIAVFLGGIREYQTRQLPGTPVGIIYSNGTYIRFDNTSQPLSVACSPMAEVRDK